MTREITHVLTIDERSILRLYVREDPSRSREGVLTILKSCIFYLDKESGIRRTMESLVEKLSNTRDAEFAAIDLSDTLTSLD